MNKNANLEKVFKQLFLQEGSSYVKYKYKIISKLISIEVIWELFHPTTSIKDELQTLFIIL